MFYRKITTSIFIAVTLSAQVRTIAYDYTELYERLSPSIVQIEADAGTGSGFVVDSQLGLIATNHHVVANTRFLAVRFPSGVRVTAEIAYLDPRHDLSILKVHGKFTDGIESLKLADEEQESLIKEGTPVVAFGSH